MSKMASVDLDGIRIPSIIADKIRPKARKTLLKVKKFVEEECEQIFVREIECQMD